MAFQVITTLADDLEEANPDTLVGLVATDERDRGIVGGGWYLGQDPVDVVIGDSAAAPLAVDVHLATGYGADDVPDVLGVVLDGSVRSMDARTRRIVTATERATMEPPSSSSPVPVRGSGAASPSPTRRSSQRSSRPCPATPRPLPPSSPAACS